MNADLGDRERFDCYQAFRAHFETSDREQFLVVLLDGRNQVLGFNVVSVGSLTASIVHPREVFKPAILANAAAVVLVHNHPSGDPEPSAEDKALTDRLRSAGDLVGIKIIDQRGDRRRPVRVVRRAGASLSLGDARFVSSRLSHWRTRQHEPGGTRTARGPLGSWRLSPISLRVRNQHAMRCGIDIAMSAL